MDKLRAMSLFVRLAERGSFTLVADELGTSKSMVSKEISRLEADIGARLLHRSTRSLQLTTIGNGYLKHCQEILERIEAAESFVHGVQEQPRGKLKINAPMALGMSHLSQVFADFMQEYPEMELDIHLNDEPVDLIENGFDLGFRAASRTFDSNYIGKPLMDFSYAVCTSKSYLQKHGAVTQVEDLVHHNCFIYSYFRGQDIWPLQEGVKIKGTLRVNSTPFMLDLIKAGLGIGFIPDFISAGAIKEGSVIELLQKVEKPRLTLYAMYPARHFVPPKIKLCIQFLQDWFEKHQKETVSR
ncbi:LysR family transcriptional regulator [Endozoicomonas sp. OPT23]|uniref:LysR family transcriptional regulator n=1 Tax=Endozoicomonas sp. OPT23 TaxID=2072845 RepID=UPI00129BFFC7|nr:LysR family transcriptional regulator [Endozoicomonas sp. OPT23]MRI32023.1 LysR family transcriptional regulator [Endozoicomonas sp. OPT23]